MYMKSQYVWHFVEKIFSMGDAARLGKSLRVLTSSLGHPKIFVKEFFNGFMAFHNHCSGQ